ncbi:hypothetical protein CPB84DRAFT_828981 [Gymnopilus junonius]|uniref:Secreted protein n=1 Tax=Gymnopilus junonius TaxID=109634 RepID=A0A9P5N9W1_GYMJU|nr:hypothetical protein CPB84DRAFT_828981 [Gymnopilus junonius]
MQPSKFVILLLNLRSLLHVTLKTWSSRNVGLIRMSWTGSKACSITRRATKSITTSTTESIKESTTASITRNIITSIIIRRPTILLKVAVRRLQLIVEPLLDPEQSTFFVSCLVEYCYSLRAVSLVVSSMNVDGRHNLNTKNY